MRSVRFRVQTMGRRPLPSVARVRPGAHSARHQDSRNDLTPCRMVWHFVSAGAHAPDSDQTLGPTPGAAHSARRLPSLASLCSSSEAKFRLIIMRYFTQDLPASKLAALSDVSRLTINQRFFKLRPRIAQLCDASSPFPARLKWMNPFLAPAVFGEKRGVEPGVKQSSSESWNGKERSTRRSSRMPPRGRYRP